MRICPKCEQAKDEQSFYKKTAGRKATYCKVCFDDIIRERWKARKERVFKAKGRKCSRCPYDKNTAALELHHVDSNQKEMDWVQMRNCSEVRFVEELEKCVLVCSNCHRELHNPHCNIESSFNG